MKTTVEKMVQYDGYIYIKGISVKKAHEILKTLDGAIIVNGFENRGHEIAFDVQWISVIELKGQKYKGDNELADYESEKSAMSVKEIAEKNKEKMHKYIEKIQDEINEKFEEGEEIEFENYRIKFVQ